MGITPKSPQNQSKPKKDLITEEVRIERNNIMLADLEKYIITFKDALYELDELFQADSEQKNLWNYVLADLLDRRPMLVEKISVMIMEQGNRHGIDWASEIIKNLIKECKNLIEKSGIENSSRKSLHTRLILLTIFSENPKLAKPTISQINDEGLLNSMISKIDSSKNSPKWLAAGLMLIEDYQKQQVFNKRMELFKKFIENKTTIWQVLDTKLKKWLTLTATENKEITDAFVQGDSEYKLKKTNEVQFMSTQPVILKFKEMMVLGTTPQSTRHNYDGRNNNSKTQKMLGLKIEDKKENQVVKKKKKKKKKKKS